MQKILEFLKVCRRFYRKKWKMKKTTFVFILLVVLISAKKGAKNKAKEDPEGSFFFHFILFFFVVCFFAPFFLWLCAGWYTLHCLRNREYLIIFFHIYIGSICSCCACTQLYQSPLGLGPTASFCNCICIHQITFSIETILLNSVFDAYTV